MPGLGTRRSELFQALAAPSERPRIGQGRSFRVAVSATGEPVLSGIVYGEAKGGVLQGLPEAGTAGRELVKGQNYVLVVLRDIAFPAARCVFTGN